MSQLVERKGFKIESTIPQKKKTKEKKSKAKVVEHVHIIDDDAPIPWDTTSTTTAKTSKKITPAALANAADSMVNDEIISAEDAPVIVGVIDERPKDIREKERFNNAKRWRTGAFEEVPEPGSIGPQPKPTKSSRQKQNVSDDSDPDIDRRQSKTNDDPDLSPPRKTTQQINNDPSPPRRRRPSNDDPSPPRRKSQVNGNDSSLSRRKREDQSSPKRRQQPDDDSGSARRRDPSPPRRKKHDDPSPPRRRRPSDDASSPPSRKRDSSPPRRKKHDDASPPRRRRPSDDDASPPRRRDQSSSSSSHRRNDKYTRKESPPSPKHRRRPKEEPSSPPAYRRPKGDSSPPLPTQPAKSERRRLAEHKEKITERYVQWGRGLTQVRQRDEAVQDYIEQAEKPLARYRDDQDLDSMLKQKEREDDPMLKYLTNKPSDAGDRADNGPRAPAKPRYRGPDPQKNRFDIWPGYRWDGVDRSNGFEKKMFETIANRHAKAQEAYLWSVEDM